VRRDFWTRSNFEADSEGLVRFPNVDLESLPPTHRRIPEEKEIGLNSISFINYYKEKVGLEFLRRRLEVEEKTSPKNPL